jgi:lipopolysaccharide/colanic/teichoic acid biosynthesis glycosyltransferase
MERVTAVRARAVASASRSHVLDEAVFRSVLVRERRRADRSNQLLAVIVLTVAEGHDSPSAWAGAIEAITAGKRETDLVGWFSTNAALGVILHDIASNDVEVFRAIENRVRRQLAARLTPKAASAISIQLHTHPELPKSKAIASVDALLEPFHGRRPQVTAYSTFKRALDLAGGCFLLLAFAPVLGVIAALVKLGSSGPVFFRQSRVGQFATPFTMLKFRTMYTNADHGLHHDFVTKFIKSSADVSQPVKDAPFKMANDPRVTPVGRILRKTSLDELPQLWNVVRGEMSLVGPRPPLSYEVEQYKAWHRRRILEVKPGMTGLWQVVGRSRTTFDEMVRLDLRYARTCSFWTDLKILMLTPRAVITGKGAA